MDRLRTEIGGRAPGWVHNVGQCPQTVPPSRPTHFLQQSGRLGQELSDQAADKFVVTIMHSVQMGKPGGIQRNRLSAEWILRWQSQGILTNYTFSMVLEDSCRLDRFRSLRSPAGK